MKQKILQVNGQKLALAIRAADSDVTLLCLHGWGASKQVFARLQNRLPLHSVAVDLPGFGASPAPAESYNVRQAAELIDRLVKELPLENVILVGHSFGGQIATNLAAENPRWLSGLALFAPAVLRTEREPGLSRLASIVGPIFSLPILSKLKPKLYDLIGADHPPENEVMRETMRMILREDQSEALAEITVPTRLVWGRADKKTPFSHTEAVTDLIVHAELTELPGGHYAAFENLTVTTDVLLFFSNELS